MQILLFSTHRRNNQQKIPLPHQTPSPTLGLRPVLSFTAVVLAHPCMLMKNIFFFFFLSTFPYTFEGFGQNNVYSSSITQKPPLCG